jgi:hypothetical protein
VGIRNNPDYQHAITSLQRNDLLHIHNCD